LSLDDKLKSFIKNLALVGTNIGEGNIVEDMENNI